MKEIFSTQQFHVLQIILNVENRGRKHQALRDLCFEIKLRSTIQGKSSWDLDPELDLPEKERTPAAPTLLDFYGMSVLRNAQGYVAGVQV